MDWNGVDVATSPLYLPYRIEVISTVIERHQQARGVTTSVVVGQERTPTSKCRGVGVSK